MATTEELRELGQQLRVDSVRAAAAGGSGHPTSSMSAADLIAVLAAEYLRYDFDKPDEPNNDHLIFSKGHASPLVYAFFKACGAIDDTELLTFRKFGSRLEGHPTPLIPWVDVATGSLGQGLPIGVGIAYSGKVLEKLEYRTWVLCGDSEMAEGSIWEAFEHAGKSGLDNLTAIIDVNRLGQRGETMHGWDLASYSNRARAFGWHAIEIDGHDVDAIGAAFEEAIATKGQPTVIVAKTLKGKGVAAVEDKNGFHGQPLKDPDAAVAELGGIRNNVIKVQSPAPGKQREVTIGTPELPKYEVGSKVAVRKAYGEALAAVAAARNDVVAIDAEVSNSTYTDLVEKVDKSRFIEVYIAEQQMIAMTVGLQVRHWKPFATTFAAFLSRAYDFVRMAAVSRADMAISGSHAGVSIGEDGPSQMALEDLAEFRAIRDSTVLYPSDGTSTAALVAQLPENPGISYLRTTRADTAVLYGADEQFPIGGSKVVRSSDNDQVTVVGAGITLHEAIAAADELAAGGTNVRVIDLYSIKPLDEVGLLEAVDATGGRLVTVEDHWREGGLGEAVIASLSRAGRSLQVQQLAVTELPGSGKPQELMAACGIDRGAIVEAVRQLAKDNGGM